MINKKILKKCGAVMLFCVLMMNFICASAINIPQTLKIKAAEKDIGYEVEYSTFYITARKMYAEGRTETVYCLDIDKDYPAGNTFKLDGSVSEKIENIIMAGYPNRSATSLNLKNDEEAYYATQVAIWAEIEGYNVNKIKGDKALINAIKDICNESKSSMNTENIQIKKYTPDNKSIQRAAVIFKAGDESFNDKNDSSINEEIPETPEEVQEEKPVKPPVQNNNNSGITEDEAENMQSPYPPQEG